jgi:hypothetical protein
LGGRSKVLAYVVEYLDTFWLTVPDNPASPIDFTEDMLRGES